MEELVSNQSKYTKVAQLVFFITLSMHSFTQVKGKSDMNDMLEIKACKECHSRVCQYVLMAISLKSIKFRGSSHEEDRIMCLTLVKLEHLYQKEFEVVLKTLPLYNTLLLQFK